MKVYVVQGFDYKGRRYSSGPDLVEINDAELIDIAFDRHYFSTTPRPVLGLPKRQVKAHPYAPRRK